MLVIYIIPYYEFDFSRGEIGRGTNHEEIEVKTWTKSKISSPLSCREYQTWMLELGISVVIKCGCMPSNCDLPDRAIVSTYSYRSIHTMM